MHPVHPLYTTLSEGEIIYRIPLPKTAEFAQQQIKVNYGRSKTRLHVFDYQTIL